MNRQSLIRVVLLALLVFGLADSAVCDEKRSFGIGGHTSPDARTGMKLLWREEFTGHSLNESNWSHETGRGGDGWGNRELQYYRPENAQVTDGFLVITARAEEHQGSPYTSSRIISRGKREFRHGRIDIRALLPEGQGIWPALWMLGGSMPEVGWPAAGEIDIMEMIGGAGRENTVHGTLHWKHQSGHQYEGTSVTLPTGTFSEQFHVYSIDWSESSIRWLVDGYEFFHFDTSDPEFDAFREDFYFVINLAVGGNWPGNPDSTTTFPQQLAVDYIRVFQKTQ